ncbi:MAG: hypothetical protein ACI4DP_00080 [Candidatus Ornithomonoglobus sp.]
MNYMGKIAEMLGVEMGERFDIKADFGLTNNNCYICENGLFDEDDTPIPAILSNILRGDVEIFKKPWRPKYDEEYWYISTEDTILRTKRNDCTWDYMAMYIGSCFRTEAEAEAHKDEIMAKFKAVMGDA